MAYQSKFLQFFWGVLFFVTLSAGVSTNTASAQYPGFSDPGSRTATGATGGLVPVSPTVDGGTIPIGATAQVVVRFRNDGSQPVETGLIRLYPSSTVSADVSLNQCREEPLPTGAECAIALSVKGLQAGAWRVEMLMSHSGRTRLVTATLSGQVESTGEASDRLTSDLEAIPNSMDFGDMNDSQTLVESIILRNITSSDIEIKDIYIDTSEQAGYSLKTACDTLKAGQACIAVVSWSPKIRGRSSGVLVIEHTGPTGLTSVPLEGEFSPQDVDSAEVFPQAVPGRGLLVSSLTQVDFGTQVSTTSTMTISLVNAGDARLEIRDIKFSGSDNGLSFAEGGCMDQQFLEPIEACPLTVSWSPTRVGPVFDDLQVIHDGARGILVLPIRGEALTTVSQDQKAIVLSGDESSSTSSGVTFDENDMPDFGDSQPVIAGSLPSVGGAGGASGLGSLGPAGTASALDGYRITSFSPSRAIINGPGGSRIVFHGEETVLGGVPWFVSIQGNGIEFFHQGKRVLLLFDKSLSSINRVSASSGGSSASGGSGGVSPSTDDGG